MFITVLICTRDRSESLRQTLGSLLIPSNLETKDWEVLVVDNGSKDDTHRVCQEAGERYPSHFRYLQETQPGKSRALNTGIASALGEVIAMTDDDVTVAPDYIRGIRTVFTEYHVDAAQGRVYLDCEGGYPKWMDREMALLFGAHDFGDKILEWKRHLAGGNMVVRASIIPKIGGFRTDLGPGGGGAGGAEDSEFAERIQGAQLHVVYAPLITVYHHLPRERLTKVYMRYRYYSGGRSLACYQPLNVPLWRYAIHVVKEWVLAEVLAVWYLLRGKPAEALHGQCQARQAAGFLMQHWRMKRGKSRQALP